MKIKKYSYLNKSVITALAIVATGASVVNNSTVSSAGGELVVAGESSPISDYSDLCKDVESSKLIQIKNDLDNKGRDFNSQKYADEVKKNFAKESSHEDLALSIDIASKVVYYSGDTQWALELKDYLMNLKANSNNSDFKAFINIHLIKMTRLLGEDELSKELLKEGLSFAKKANNDYLQCELYYASAMADIVDLNMNKTTFENLKNAIKLAKTNEKGVPVSSLINYYILQSQTQLYFKKDPSSASDLLGKALILAQENKLPQLELRVQEFQASTYPFFFKYDEGISYLKPLVDERIQNNQSLESVIVLDKLINMYFDSGNYDEALGLGPKLKEMIAKVENPYYKKYFNEYTLALYTVNELFLSGEYNKAIDLINSKDYKEFENFISIDRSVTNMFLGNLYATIGDNENCLKSFKEMFKALAANSDGNEFVYTDTSMSLAGAYANLERYKEAYETLQTHLDAYVSHQMDSHAKESEKLHKMYANEKEQRTILENRVFIITTGALVSIIGLAVFDIIKSRKYNKVLASLSVTDSLTGLSNRRVLDEFLNQRSYLANKLYYETSEVYTSAIMLDIDNFKKYNDNYGHVLGDKVLEQIGLTLKEYTYCDSDIVARYGGEEFTIMLMDHDMDKAKDVSEKIRASVESLAIEHKYSTCTDIVTVSIGVSTKNIASDDFDSIIVEADKALYYSKENGKNRVTHYEDLSSSNK